MCVRGWLIKFDLCASKAVFIVLICVLGMIILEKIGLEKCRDKWISVR